MYEYSFISIPIQRRRDGLFTNLDYRKVIQDEATAGWEFVQVIPFESHVDPRLDLVFKRKVSS